MTKKDQYINQVLGLKVDSSPHDRVLNYLEKRIRTGRKTFVVTLNPEMVMAAQTDRQLTEVINRADLVIPDGNGIVWALRRQGNKTVKRLAGTDLMLRLVKCGYKTVLCGAGPGIAQKAAEVLRSALAGTPARTDLVGDLVGISDPDVQIINRLHPDLLFVALGHGKQEKWLAKNLPKLKVKLAMGVGGALDQIAKPWLRAPRLIQNLGLEWLYRLVFQPWRIRRQWQLVRFLVKIYL